MGNFCCFFSLERALLRSRITEEMIGTQELGNRDDILLGKMAVYNRTQNNT